MNDTKTESVRNTIHFGWRILAAIEMLTAVFLLEFSIWTSQPQVRLVSGILAGCMIFRCLFCYGRRPEYAKFHSSLATGTILATTFLMGLILAGAFFALDLWSPNFKSLTQRTVADWLMVKVPTVVLQQILFQLVFIPTLLFLTGNRTIAVIGSALIFAFLHLPNPLLIVLTLTIGVFWFWQAIDRPRLVTLTVSHLFLAVVLATVAEEYVFDMRVGQICFQKWPAMIESQTDQKTIYVYPRPLRGELQKVTQSGTQVSIRGQVFDPERFKAPQIIHVVLGSFDADDTIGKSWSPRWILEVDQVENSGEFELKIDSSQIEGPFEIRVFARHKHGWSYPVNGSARIRIAATENSGELVCLYPKQIQGNVGHIKRRNERTDLIGWAFTRPYHQYVDTILVPHNGKLKSLPLERRRRVEIADFFEDERLIECGFITRLPFRIGPGKTQVYVRNPDGELERVPVELASNTNRVANEPSRLR